VKLLVPENSIDIISRHITVLNDSTKLTLSVLLDITICDIFNKFDVQSKKSLSLSELKGLVDCFTGDEETKMVMMAKFQFLIQKQEKESG
jgi:hypothetical protein